LRGRGAFDEEDDLDRRNSGPDAEFTLGAGTLVLVFGGLVVVCGIFFGLGYMAGRHGTVSPTAAQQVTDVPTTPQAGSTQQKPSATTQAPVAAPAQPTPEIASASQPAPTDSSGTAAAGANQISSAPNTKQTAMTQQEHPPLSVAVPAPAPRLRPPPEPMPESSARQDESESQSQARPASLQSNSGLWVQVAAVSHVEDAQVLTNALRKHGYVVTPRRESDNLIHVRIGPFGTRDEANRWSMKLLNDGYNAEVQ